MAANWKKIADRLGERMSNHAYNCAAHSDYRAGVAEDCPFCDDTAAYEEYIAAGGSKPKPIAGRMVSIQDIK